MSLSAIPFLSSNARNVTRDVSPGVSANISLAMQKKRQLLDALAELDGELEGLGLTQKREYNANSPLGRLPDEILAIIFFEIIDLIRDEQSEKMRARILATCHRWLSVGLRTPRIWNRIVVRRGRSARVHTRYPRSYLRAQLVRSKSAPLGIWIHTDALNELKKLFVLVEPHLHRTQILHILIPMSRGSVLDLPRIFTTLPNCRDLSIYCRPDQVPLYELLPSPSQLPKLTTLCLGAEHAMRLGDLPPMPALSSVNYSGITHLSLGAFPPQTIVELLGLCPALKSLAIRGVRGMTLETGHLAPLTLPHLEHLEVQGQFERYCLGRQFEAPRLESLSLLGEAQQFLESDPQKFPELRGAILNPHTLSPRIRSHTRTFITDFLCHHPKLEWLTIIPLPEYNLLAEDDEEPEVQEIQPALYEALSALLPRPIDEEIQWPNFRTLVVHGAHISERSQDYENHLRELIAVAHNIRFAMPQEITVYFPGSVPKRFLERVLDLPYNPFIEPRTSEGRDPRWAQRRLFGRKYD